MSLKRTTTDSNVFIMTAERRSAFGQISSVTKRHTRKEKDLNVRIRGVKHLDSSSRAKTILKST